MQTIMSILAGKELFETSDQGDSFTMGIHVGNHFMRLHDFCGELQKTPIGVSSSES